MLEHLKIANLEIPQCAFHHRPRLAQVASRTCLTTARSNFRYAVGTFAQLTFLSNTALFLLYSIAAKLDSRAGTASGVTVVNPHHVHAQQIQGTGSTEQCVTTSRKSPHCNSEKELESSGRLCSHQANQLLRRNAAPPHSSKKQSLAACVLYAITPLSAILIIALHTIGCRPSNLSLQ